VKICAHLKWPNSKDAFSKKGVKPNRRRAPRSHSRGRPLRLAERGVSAVLLEGVELRLVLDYLIVYQGPMSMQKRQG
jgi:hypothetical protein